MLILGVAGASILLLGLAFFMVYRPWHSRWGATDEEIALEMPGDLRDAPMGAGGFEPLRLAARAPIK